jgi:hypothetical protein
MAASSFAPVRPLVEISPVSLTLNSAGFIYPADLSRLDASLQRELEDISPVFLSVGEKVPEVSEGFDYTSMPKLPFTSREKPRTAIKDTLGSLEDLVVRAGRPNLEADFNLAGGVQQLGKTKPRGRQVAKDVRARPL